MATDESFANFVLEQLALPRRASVRKMFGEYALYVDDKVVALLCDDQLFLKPLEPLRARLARVDEAPPYPGAKPHFRLADELERPDELRALMMEAARLLPAPKVKPAAKKKATAGAAPKPKLKATPKSKPKAPAKPKAASPSQRLPARTPKSKSGRAPKPTPKSQSRG